MVLVEEVVVLVLLWVEVSLGDRVGVYASQFQRNVAERVKSRVGGNAVQEEEEAEAEAEGRDRKGERKRAGILNQKTRRGGSGTVGHGPWEMGWDGAEGGDWPEGTGRRMREEDLSWTDAEEGAGEL